MTYPRGTCLEVLFVFGVKETCNKEIQKGSLKCEEGTLKDMTEDNSCFTRDCVYSVNTTPEGKYVTSDHSSNFVDAWVSKVLFLLFQVKMK